MSTIANNTLQIRKLRLLRGVSKWSKADPGLIPWPWVLSQFWRAGSGVLSTWVRREGQTHDFLTTCFSLVLVVDIDQYILGSKSK